MHFFQSLIPFNFSQIIFFLSFIYQLKVQEAMRKKEKFQREHEEVSQDFSLYLEALRLFFALVVYAAHPFYPAN